MVLGYEDMLFCENLPKFWQVKKSEIFNLFLLTFLAIEG